MPRKASEADKRRTNKPEQITDMAEIDAMPVLLEVPHLARITGSTELYMAKQCREGMFADIAVRCGRRWKVNKAKALQILGLA